MNKSNPIGVLLLNLGGPDSLGAVRPFLYNLFSDRMIIRLGPALLQKPIAWFISKTRSSKAADAYALIGGKSPILEITEAQARAVEEALRKERKFRVYVGMRYWFPFIREALDRMEEDGVRDFIALPLFPQYSIATTGSSLEQMKRDLKGRNFRFEAIGRWYTHPLYIEALADAVRKGLDKFEGEVPFVLFSAHGLPVKFIEMGDPYEKETRETVRLVAERAGVRDYAMGYQSRTGPVKWLEPSTDEVIRELAGKGVKNLLVVAVSFVSDHVETLYEIDILYKGLAEGLGVRLERAEALNTHPLLIGALRDLILAKKRELGW